MLTNYAQINTFDQFLFSHFCIKESPATKKVKSVSAKKKAKTVIMSDLEVAQELPKLEAIEKAVHVESDIKAEIKNLAEVIDSIPNKVRAMNIEELAHKHETEWYHAFRDLKEEISKDISKRHPGNMSVLKMKSEIKEFTELLDEHIEKAMLEIERIFQAFPSLSRVALIYLLSIIIAIPLMFFSMNADKHLTKAPSFNEIHLSNIDTTQLTQEMKSDYIAKNSARILASGRTEFELTDLPQKGKVAGVFEDNEMQDDTKDKKTNTGEKITSWYRYINDLKDELNNLFSK